MASPKQGEALTILKKKLCRVYCLICFLAINPLTVRDWNTGDEVVYPNVEDNAALLLLFPVKDHPFNDGCKRIGVFSEEWTASRNKAGFSVTCIRDESLFFTNVHNLRQRASDK